MFYDVLGRESVSVGEVFTAWNDMVQDIPISPSTGHQRSGGEGLVNREDMLHDLENQGLIQTNGQHADDSYMFPEDIVHQVHS